MMNTIIVGAGIAGLFIADKLVSAGVQDILIIEKEGHSGGRIITSNKHHVEIGAGRLHSSHRNVLALLKRFDLETIPIGGASLFRRLGSTKTRPNAFETAFPPLADLLRRLPYTDLATNTIRQLLTRILGSRQTEALLSEFPYRAEVDSMRADLGLKAFADGIGNPDGYCVVKGGLSSLITAMTNHLKKAGVAFMLNTEVLDVTATGVRLATGVLEADRIILALPAWNLKTMPCLKDDATFKLLGSSALTRIYATYPTTDWFGPNPKKLVTDSPLRYIIPVSRDTLMISYTDGADTKTYKGLEGTALQRAIQRDLRNLFPEKAKEIPEPTWIQAYEWSEGTTYWKPGSYDPVQQGKAMLQPKPSAMPNLFICGESFSEKQAWIEGALEHADLLWTTHLA